MIICPSVSVTYTCTIAFGLSLAMALSMAMPLAMALFRFPFGYCECCNEHWQEESSLAKEGTTPFYTLPSTVEFQFLPIFTCFHFGLVGVK